VPLPVTSRETSDTNHPEDCTSMNVSLVMFKEDGQQKEFPLAPGKTIVGRREECDLRIPLAEISRKHALVIVEGNVVTLRDLGSANGTYINNRRISEQELSPGDHIVIGPVVFTVKIDGEPAEVRPVQTRLETRPPSVKRSAAGRRAEKPAAAQDELGIGDDEEDPISALEALAGTDDTTAIDLDDSFTSSEDSQG